MATLALYTDTMDSMNHFPRQTFLQSLLSAFRGVAFVVRRGANFRRQLVVFFLVLVGAAILRLPLRDVVVVILASGAVLSFEAINSALEMVEDIVHPDHHLVIQRSKDVAAGAVVLMSATAVVIGVLVFGARLYSILVS